HLAAPAVQAAASASAAPAEAVWRPWPMAIVSALEARSIRMSRSSSAAVWGRGAGWQLGSGRALAQVPAVTPRPAGNGSSSWSSGFPCCIGARQANGAGPVPGGDGGLLIGEENPVGGVATADDGA